MVEKTNTTIFMDESGNTGSNLLDLSQPVFTLVGIGIANNNLEDMRDEILNLKQKYKIQSELHGIAIFKRGKDKIIADIVDLLMGNNFDLFIGIAEKRYVIATFIESDFFDPAFNDRCDNFWTYPSPERAKNANFLFEHLSEETLNACGKFFSKGEKIEKAYELILQDIKDKEYILPLWEILLGAEPHLDELQSTIKDALSDEKTIHSPNFFTYCGMMNKIEHWYSNIAKNKCELIFDSSREFNNAFLKIFTTMQNARPAKLKFSKKIPFITGYNSILEFNAEDSKNNIFIQCADLLASAINRVMTKIFNHGKNVKLSNAEVSILFLIYSHWKEFEDVFCDYVCKIRPNSNTQSGVSRTPNPIELEQQIRK